MARTLLLVIVIICYWRTTRMAVQRRLGLLSGWFCGGIPCFLLSWP